MRPSRNLLLIFFLASAFIALVNISPAAAAQPFDSGTPFQKGFELSGSSDACASFTVPAGQRLVVQYFAGSLIVPTGKQFAGTVTGQTATDVDDMFVNFVFNRESVGPTQDRLTFSQSTLFYVEAGQTLDACFQPLPLGSSFSFFGSLAVTGSLVKVGP